MNNLMSRLPSYYFNSSVAKDITNVLQNDLDLFNFAIESTLNQFYVNECDEYINRYEEEFDIKTDESKDLEFRRNVLISKIRGTGTTTKDMIKNVSDAFTNGDVEVIEDNDNYRFIVKFTSILGIPINLDDLINAIEEIKPAHLECIYEFKYNTHAVLSKFTHSQLMQFTHNELREGDLNVN